jgi:GTP pyrophosphokinase
MGALVDAVLSYYADADSAKLWRAFDLGLEAHQGQLRKSGEPYFVHPLAVAEVLCELRLDVDTIVAGLLHDVVEDTGISLAHLTRDFGNEVSVLVDGVTKINEIRYENPEDQQAENYRKMLLTMARDVRVILIKLADRLHNMRTIEALAPDRQIAIAEETMIVYAPLAHRFGVAKLKWELEDLSFKTLQPADYASVAAGVNARRAEREDIITEFSARLREYLQDDGISSEIEGRPKHFHSIWKKMQRRNAPVEEIFDLLAVRIVLSEVSEPIHDRLKDFVASPKRNMYQSLHSTVYGPDGHIIEVQIRTAEMHRRAEVGIAAHWLYKEGAAAGAEDRLDEQLRSFREALEFQQDVNNPREFMDALKTDLFHDEVYVFSPNGDVFKLAYGSTPLDFAFNVHSEVGLHCSGARVDGKLVSLRHELKSGETVEIITSKTATPSAGWLDVARTSKARHHIRHWIKSTQVDESMRLGREMVERELKKRKAKIDLDPLLEEAAQDLGHTDASRLLTAIGSGSMPLSKVVNKLVPVEQKKRRIPLQDRLQRALKRNNQSGVRIQGLDNLMIRFARCCQPVPGDSITGIVTVGRGVSVHQSDCENLSPKRMAPDRLIEVSWDVGEDSAFPVQLVVSGHDRMNLLADISRAISDMGVNIQAGSFEGTNEYAHCTFVVEVRNLAHLDKIIKSIRRLGGVDRVERAAVGPGGDLFDPVEFEE